jgi:hypothetical protein
MSRSLQLGSALAALVVACGNANDGDLYDGTSVVEARGGTNGAPAGGDTTLGGRPVSGSSGGATAAGGEAATSGGSTDPGASGASTGGVPVGEAGSSEPGNGGVPSSSAGQNDGSGGTSPTGGSSAGTGGIPSNGEGGSTAAPSGGSTPAGGTDASGGTASGGVASGGISAGGFIGLGGASCQQARQSTAAALEAAQACEPDAVEQQCLGYVDGDCCAVPVNDPDSEETAAYLSALAKMKKLCGATICATILCVNSTPKCESRGSGSARCVSRGGLAI